MRAGARNVGIIFPTPHDPTPQHPAQKLITQTQPADLYEFLVKRPPSEQQADAMAIEELLGPQREEIFTLLDYFRGRQR